MASGTADERTLLRALWDLVWAGEVTNDTLAPLRAFVRGASAKVRAVRPGSRPRPGALRRQGPPAGAGRWSLVAGLVEPAPTPTEAAHARALQLLDRHGVLTRESVLAENTPGGFAGVYPVLKAMEEAGKVRRGYFVAGLGAAQFALPGAVDRLRSMREAGAETSPCWRPPIPAQPYGASLDWPDSAGRPSRAAGAYVVLRRRRPGGLPGARRPLAGDLRRGPLAMGRRAGLAGEGRAPAQDRAAAHRRRTGARTRPTPKRCARSGSSTATAGSCCEAEDAMPEGDTIHRTAVTLRRVLAGRTVTAFETAAAADRGARTR